MSSPTPAVNAQRASALRVGDSVRSLRAELKRDLRTSTDPAGLLGRLILDPPGYLNSARAFDVLTWLPGIKAPRSDAILRIAGVTGALTTVAELDADQRSAIADLLATPPTLTASKRPKRRRPLVAAPVLDDIPF